MDSFEKLLRKVRQIILDSVTHVVVSRGSDLTNKADTLIRNATNSLEEKLKRQFPREKGLRSMLIIAKDVVTDVATQVIHELLTSKKLEKKR